MRPHLWILDGKTPVPVKDVLEWGRWFEETARAGKRHVAQTDLGDGVRVSTVFLGIDHNYGSGAPILFETMVFGLSEPGSWTDDMQERYETWQQAEQGHEMMLRRTQAVLDRRKQENSETRT